MNVVIAVDVDVVIVADAVIAVDIVIVDAVAVQDTADVVIVIIVVDKIKTLSRHIAYLEFFIFLPININ